MTTDNALDDPNARAASRGAYSVAHWHRAAHFSTLHRSPNSHALTAAPIAEAGQLYPDEDTPRDC